MKLIVLNSGGFDSTVLLHEIKEQYPDSQIHCLHFSYGQPNSKQEYECARRSSEQLGCVFVPVELAPMNWSKSGFYDSSFISVEKQELEYRNLIFISYAVSYATSISASKIYAAILKSHYGYKDTSPLFFDMLNKFLEYVGVQVVTPFIDYDKDELDNLAFRYRITQEDFFSCDTPIEGKPCGVCPDCVCLKSLFNRIKPDTPEKRLSYSGFDYEDEQFLDILKKESVDEVRLYTNNVCQLRCKHCYYGFDDMKGDPLSVEEYKNVIRQCVEAGVVQFHFSGKEPLADNSIFEYAKYIKENFPQCKFDVVTNGILVPKYAQELKDLGFYRICVSIDNIRGKGEYREKSFAIEAINAANKVGIPTTVFIDLSGSNCRSVHDTMYTLYREFGVRDFYIRCISPIGNAEDFTLMSLDDINEAFLQMYSFSEAHEDCVLTFCIPQVYVHELLISGGDREVSVIVEDVLTYANSAVFTGFYVIPEIYCGRYDNQITITPDGYVLGCASETSCPNYDEISAGNVRDKSIKDIISEGKRISVKVNRALKHKEFTMCTFKMDDPID